MSEEAIDYEAEAPEQPEVAQAEEHEGDEPESGGQEEAAGDQEETAEERKARIEFTDEQQKYINDHIVARQVAKRKEAERQVEEYQQRLQEYESQAQQTQDGEPKIPDPPNIWDDNYEEKIKERDAALIRHAEWRAEQKARQDWEQRQQYEQAQQEQQALLKRVETYTERAKSEYGIDPSDLQVAGNAVSQFGIPDQLTQFILDDDAGPAITVHLSRNLAELEQLNQMDPIRAAVYVATEIKPRAVRNAKRRSSPPEPVENPKGGGIPEKERGPDGAIYE